MKYHLQSYDTVMKAELRTSYKIDLHSCLKDPEFARVYGEHIARAELAAAITRARKEAGLTQQELA